MKKSKLLHKKTIAILGGTGSLGKILVKRLLDENLGKPEKIIVFSRDEAKQHNMRLEFEQKEYATDELIYQNFKRILEFRIGDVRDYASVCAVIKNANIVINAAALKQVPTCEYFPFEAVQTNVIGPENIVRAILENDLKVETVVGVSTDKACKPVNVMGMTKALQERIFTNANIMNKKTRFICVRYGNVLASRGSVIPLFLEQIANGGPITITTKEMTRFLLYLDNAVDIIFEAIKSANPGEIYLPKVPSARIIDVARVLIGNKKINIILKGIRPGEKIHEILASDEEASRTVDRGKYYAIKPLLPELLVKKREKTSLTSEYSSSNSPLDYNQTKELLSDLITHIKQKTGKELLL